ncbi:MAG: flagellar type III secretion system protein FlhB [Burkholderiaceae bacterium]|nr:flagellar type III secretion system protein FlhB [Burkholderiaceae bacterium]
MADQDAQDRNLPASARKLKKAREEGNVPRSRDFGHFAALAGGGLGLVLMMPTLVGWTRAGLSRGLSFGASSRGAPSVMFEQLADLVAMMLWVVVPMGLWMTGIGIASSLAVGGWNWTLKPLMPKATPFNLLAGVTRMFSKQQLIDAGKASILALLLGSVGCVYLYRHVDEFRGLVSMSLSAGLTQAGSAIQGGLWLLLGVLALFALVDAPLQRYLNASKLKMSAQEQKQEHKESEGSQEVKGRRKQLMHEMSRRRMLAAVPTADLVVMNPTHYAVALKYDEGRMGAPRVVAKGADLLAMTIRDTARKAEVPVLQAPVLARALYAHAEVDREIPAALFAAVAQVLAYVYQLRAAMTGRGAMPADLPELSVPPELDPHNDPDFVPPTPSTEGSAE